MLRKEINGMLTERLYALLAYVSAITIFMLGGYIISLAAMGGIIASLWQIVLAVMVVPLLAAIVGSCGNHRENARVRAATWIIVALLSSINPIAWLGALILIAQVHGTIVPQHAAAGDEP